MICSEEDKILLKENAPYVYTRFLKFEEENKDNGLTVSFRGTDHTYDSFRWGLSRSINIEPTFKWKFWGHSGKEESPEEISYKKLCEDIETHCCICGSTHMVSLRDFNDKVSSTVFERLCARCYGKRLYGYQKVIHFAKYNQWCKEYKSEPNIPHIKVRLLNDSGNLFYDWLENLYYLDDNFYVSNSLSKAEHVRYAGIFLGVRDKNNERVYEGDIVVGQINQNNNIQKFWGMAFEAHPSIQEGYRPDVNHIWLEHGGNNFPSPLSAADSFEVVGNVIDGNETAISLPRLEMYYKGWEIE